MGNACSFCLFILQYNVLNIHKLLKFIFLLLFKGNAIKSRTVGVGMLACIGLNGIKFSANLGVYEHEKQSSQIVTADLEIWFDIQACIQDDDFEKTIDYQEVVDVLSKKASSRHYALIETLSAELSKEMMDHFSAIQKLRLKIYKSKPLDCLESSSCELLIKREHEVCSSHRSC
ncbi:MAG: dihydroneopterin aldolase [Chlamydiales bacterium]|nr:dihydroneopterin aldolase [Chlamydiales bacterium]